MRETAFDLLDQAIAHLPRRQVHRNHEVRAERAPPFGQLLARALQHPGADRDNQAGVLRDRDELHRRDVAQFAVVPAQERFRADCAAAPAIDDRLVDETQLARRQRAAQELLDREAPLQVLVQLRGKELEVVAAALLGRVHRRVGIAHQGRHIKAVFRKEADADRRPQVVLVAGHGERHAHRLEDLARESDQISGVVVTAHDNHELVAAHPRERALCLHARREPARHAAQERIARFVAGRVVDLLEAVQIDEQHGNARELVIQTRRLEQVAHPLGQVGAVIEAGERIAGGEVFELLLGLAHRADIGKRDQYRPRLALARLQDRHHVQVDPDNLAVGELKTDRHTEHRFAGREHAHRRALGVRDRRAVFMIGAHHHGKDIVAEEVRPRMQHALRTRIAGQHHTVARLHHDALIQVIDDQTVMLFALREALRDGVLMDREADAAANVAQHRLLFETRAAPGAMVDGERAEHPALVVLERDRPARAQADRQREMPEVRPQRIRLDVLDHDHPPQKHRRAARADLRADDGAVERSGVRLRQRGRAAGARMDAILIEQQDRTTRALAEQCLRIAAHFVEQLRQRRIARDQPQYAALGSQQLLGHPRRIAGAVRRCCNRVTWCHLASHI